MNSMADLYQFMNGANSTLDTKVSSIVNACDPRYRGLQNSVACGIGPHMYICQCSFVENRPINRHYSADIQPDPVIVFLRIITLCFGELRRQHQYCFGRSVSIIEAKQFIKSEFVGASMEFVPQ